MLNVGLILIKNIVFIFVIFNLFACSSNTDQFSRQEKKAYAEKIIDVLIEAKTNATSEGKKYLFSEKSNFKEKQLQQFILTITEIEYMNGNKDIFEIVNVISISPTRECWRIKTKAGKLKLYKLRSGIKTISSVVDTIKDCN